jgi:hypothetical protein
MGHALCLQRWTEIVGVAGQTVTQHNSEWADIAGYDMAAVYLEVSQCTTQGTASSFLNLQTAPDPDDDMFGDASAVLYSHTFTGTPTLGLLPVTILGRDNLARYLRWQVIVGTVATNIHFRIWLNLHQAGW